MVRNPTLTFGAVGDISFASRMGDDMARYGADWPFERMLPHLRRADLLFGNMESVAIPDDYPHSQIDPDGLVSLFPGPQGAAALKRASFDFMNLAANHVLDAGRVGMDHTKACLEEAGLATAGVGYTQEEARQLRVLEKGGLSFGFLCYGEDSNYTLGHTSPSYAYYEVEAVCEDVIKHRQEVDILVVSIHADLEFMPTPSLPRLRNSRRIARAGADIILEHHPHGPLGVVMVKGWGPRPHHQGAGASLPRASGARPERRGGARRPCLIAYSLGNFLFDAHTGEYMKNNGPHTAHSFLLLVEVSRRGVQSFERIPFIISEPPEQRPAPARGAEREEALAHLAGLDAKLQDEEFVKATWREIAKRHLAGVIQTLAKQDIDRVIEEAVGRYCLLAENRSWMLEILEMGREQWLAQQQDDDPLHRPHYRFADRE
jgi:hypothetical protein